MNWFVCTHVGRGYEASPMTRVTIIASILVLSSLESSHEVDWGSGNSFLWPLVWSKFKRHIVWSLSVCILLTATWSRLAAPLLQIKFFVPWPLCDLTADTVVVDHVTALVPASHWVSYFEQVQWRQ